LCVLEAAFTSFGQGGAESAGNDYIVGVLLENEVLVGWEIGLRGVEMRRDLGETLNGFIMSVRESDRQKSASLPTEFFPAWLAIFGMMKNEFQKRVWKEVESEQNERAQVVCCSGNLSSCSRCRSKITSGCLGSHVTQCGHCLAWKYPESGVDLRSAQ